MEDLVQLIFTIAIPIIKYAQITNSL